MNSPSATSSNSRAIAASTPSTQEMVDWFTKFKAEDAKIKAEDAARE